MLNAAMKERAERMQLSWLSSIGFTTPITKP